MNFYAPIFNLEEFGPHNMLSALRAEVEHTDYLPKRNIDFRIQFSENEDFNAAAYEIGDRAYINISITTAMQVYHHVLLLMGRGELLPEGGKEEPYEGKYRIEEFEIPQICPYDEKYKRWSLKTLPFLPEEFKYEVIPGVAKQFKIVSGLLNRTDVDTIYVCTDSGREGEYIYRLVEQMAQVRGKRRLRVWIDSQTEEEILRGIREAKDLSEYDNLSASAYLRAKEDYLMGINFSRLLTLKYGDSISNYLNKKYSVISVGRVMTCVLGMVVRREREIREFV